MKLIPEIAPAKSVPSLLLLLMTKEGLLEKKAIQDMSVAVILEIVPSRLVPEPRPTVIADTYRMKLITESEKCGVS